MSRVIVEIYVPAAERAFDVSIPTDLPLYQVTALTAVTLSELSGGLYKAGPDAVLCDRKTGEFLNANVRAWELGIQNGSQLMLI